VIKEPLLIVASTTSTALESSAMMRRELRKQQSFSCNLLVEPAVGRGITDVNTTAEHGDGAAPYLERGSVGNRIDAEGEATDDDGTRAGGGQRERACSLHAVFGATPRTNHGEHLALHQAQAAAREEGKRWSG
jgi:hypothetical protein